MNIIILYLEPSIRRMLQEVLELEGYTVICTQSVSEAIRVIEESTDPYLLFTDNLKVRPEARDALASLHNRPELRQRIWVVSLDIWTDPAWITDGMIDEFLSMPFTVEQLLHVVEAYAGHPPV